jgi:hypothetical protein
MQPDPIIYPRLGTDLAGGSRAGSRRSRMCDPVAPAGCGSGARRIQAVEARLATVADSLPARHRGVPTAFTLS